MVEVTLISEQAVLAEGLRVMLCESGQARVFRSVASMQEAASVEPPPGESLLLVDVDKTLDLSLLRELCRSRQQRVCLFARSISPELFYQAREAGVSGILSTSRSASEIVGAICAMSEGQMFFDPLLHETAVASRAIHLSPREGHLVELLTRGLKNKEIAYQLGITEGTVKVYLSKLFQKVGAKDRFDLALSGLKNLGMASMPSGDNPLNTTAAAPDRIRTLVTRVPPVRERRSDLHKQAV